MSRKAFREPCSTNKEIERVDARVGRIASRQRGLVTRRQLIDCGLDDAQILRRTRRGSLYRIHRAVYAVGSSHLDADAEKLAAVLALPDGAAIGSISTIEHFAFTRFKSKRLYLEAPRHSTLALPNANVTTTAAWALGEVTTRCGVPTTRVAWAITRLGERLTQHQVCNVIREAAWRRHARPEDVHRLLALHRTTAGHAVVAAALRARAQGSAGSKSFLEDALIAAYDRVSMRPYLVNVHVPTRARTIEVDIYVPSLRLCLEADGKPHDEPAQQEEDATRDAELRADGYRVSRFHWSLIDHRPDLVEQRLRALLE